MSNEEQPTKDVQEQPEQTAEKPAEEAKKPAAQDNSRNDSRRGGRRDDRRGGGKGGRRSRRKRDDREKDEFESTIIDLARVTRVMAGGKRMSFRVCVVVGDKKGRIGMGVKKGADVQLAVSKATEYAKKHLIDVKLADGTIPHTVTEKFKGARVLLKPAKQGTGVIAGGAIRVVMQLAGITNIVAKIQGSSNKVNNVTAVVEALRKLRNEDDIKSITS